MDLKRLFSKGKKIVDDRGGVESLKQDAAELQGIAKGKGSLSDKAKGAAAAIKEPGAPGGAEKAGGADRAGKPDAQDGGAGKPGA